MKSLSKTMTTLVTIATTAALAITGAGALLRHGPVNWLPQQV